MSVPWKTKVGEMLQIRDDWRDTTSESSEWSWIGSWIWKKLMYWTLWGEDLVLRECVISWHDHSPVGVKQNASSKKIHNEVLGSKGTWLYKLLSLFRKCMYMCVCGERYTKREKHGKILIGKYKWRVQRCSL